MGNQVFVWGIYDFLVPRQYNGLLLNVRFGSAESPNCFGFDRIRNLCSLDYKRDQRHPDENCFSPI